MRVLRLPAARPARARRKRYVPVIGPRLQKLLFVVFALFALLALNAVYLVGVSILEWSTGKTYQNWFYMNMFLVHLVLGALFILPVVIFALGAAAWLSPRVPLDSTARRHTIGPVLEWLLRWRMVPVLLFVLLLVNREVFLKAQYID